MIHYEEALYQVYVPFTFYQTPRPTQPGHPFVARRYEYQRKLGRHRSRRRIRHVSQTHHRAAQRANSDVDPGVGVLLPEDM